MGVIKDFLKNTAEKVKNGVVKEAVLSGKQLKDIQNKREKYLSEMPDPNDTTAKELTERLLAANGIEIYNEYLSRLKELYVPVERDEFNRKSCVRFFNVTKWVVDKSENSIDKLVNVYQVLAGEECNVSLIFHRTVKDTQVYMGVTNTKDTGDNIKVKEYNSRLEDAIRGNFPGSDHTEAKDGTEIFIPENKDYSVSIVSNVPTEKSERFVSQSIEKLLDGIIPDKEEKEYIVILLATPVRDLESRRIDLAYTYSGLYPYASWETNYTYNEQNGTGDSRIREFNLGASIGFQKPIDLPKDTDDQQNGEKKKQGGEGENDKLGEAAEKTIKYVNTPLGEAIIEKLGKSMAEAIKGFTHFNLGANVGGRLANTSHVMATVGHNEGVTQKFINYSIKHALELLEKQMDRIDLSAALGMWDFAAYVLSEDKTVANNVAHSYLALTQGEESYTSKSAINSWWGKGDEDTETAKAICGYLRELRHPVFALNPKKTEEAPDFYVYPALVNATATITGKELAYSLNFPRKSISGLSVIECVEFGRNVLSYDAPRGANGEIELGNVFHMYRKENTPVCFSKKSLAMHTLVTGGLGTGKSNVICQMLNALGQIPFMVIEPSKGEYKGFLGGNVTVYSADLVNPGESVFLKIDPFKFSEKVHFLEHTDRLVELLKIYLSIDGSASVILKRAIEKSYQDCGWEKDGKRTYPTFDTVIKNVNEIIDRGEYDTYNKKEYSDMLLNGLRSLTSGVNGMIFASDGVSDDDLFKKNVIIDLSRIFSNEIKALIMGLLVLKLQEYRIGELSDELKHITVLEEAHTVLKRTIDGNSSQGVALSVKNSEMIGNVIAEMRNYGEGFIIVDQAPGNLDLSVIRNTNTKIIMRLPDRGDRELVGQAANLNEDQIVELAKLPRGVCAVYQNEWVQPVLCQVSKFDIQNSKK